MIYLERKHYHELQQVKLCLHKHKQVVTEKNLPFCKGVRLHACVNELQGLCMCFEKASDVYVYILVKITCVSEENILKHDSLWMADFCSWHQISLPISFLCLHYVPLSLLSSSTPASVCLHPFNSSLHYSVPSFSSHSMSLSLFPTVCEAFWLESALSASSEWNTIALIVMCLMLLDLLQEVNHVGQ